MIFSKVQKQPLRLGPVAVVFVMSGALVFATVSFDDVYDQIHQRDQKTRKRDHQVQRLVDTHAIPPFGALANRLVRGQSLMLTLLPKPIMPQFSVFVKDYLAGYRLNDPFSCM